MEIARELGEAKRTLEDIEATALSSVAQVLAEVAESLSRTTKNLADIHPAEWMTAEQATKHLGCRSVEAFEKIAAREGIPKHYYLHESRGTTAPNSTLGSWVDRKRGPKVSEYLGCE